MKKLATVFIVAVMVPTLVLAWLAVRSMRDQEIVINSQRALLHQRASDALAADLNTFMDDVRFFFSQLVDELVVEQGAEPLSRNFDTVIQDRWKQASFGCVVTDDGKFLSPDISQKNQGEEVTEFMVENRLFLTNQSRALVYQAPAILNSQIVVTQSELSERGGIFKSKEEPLKQQSRGTTRALEKSVSDVVVAKPAGSVDRKKIQSGALEQEMEAVTSAAPAPAAEAVALAAAPQIQAKVEVAGNKIRSAQYSSATRALGRDEKDRDELMAVPAQSGSISEKADAFRAGDEQATDPAMEPVARNVQPALRGYAVLQEDQKQGGRQEDVFQNSVGNWSNLERNAGNLKELMGDKEEGAISRFLQDGLHILLWNRHPAAPDRVFWAELNLGEIRKDLKKVVDEVGGSSSDEVSLALLDSDGDVVAQTVSGFRTDWKRPFVAAEVGEILPHWEVAAYLIDPGIVNRSARSARLTIWLLVPTLLAAIAVGSYLIFRAIGLEMHLARQKTDFVSNVSHELKTPLTSIRMFSDLLKSGDSKTHEKSREYSGIISSEAARLTRLINNLLDFSRMDRNEMRYRKGPLDVVDLTREIVANYRMQLESEGCVLRLQDEIGDPVMINGDRDAVSQAILNLLSNAEKYGCSGGEVEVRISSWEEKSGAQIEVMDRGPGIDRKYAGRIFEKFYRVDDSLSTGIQGSGLGLTLAQQIVNSHGGTISYKNRSGGGSHFTIQLPGIEENS